MRTTIVSTAVRRSTNINELLSRKTLTSQCFCYVRPALFAAPSSFNTLNQKSNPVVSYSTSRMISKDLPYHLVVGLPALSPTMEAGSLAEWYVTVGDTFSAGDGIAKIETDKAAMDFEAQDDGYVAKILMEAGLGNDIPVGTPIMITVEDKADIEAFKDYIYTPDTSVSVKGATEASLPPPPPPVVVAAPTPPPVVASVIPAPPTPAVVMTQPPPAVAAVQSVSTSSSTTTAFSTAWGLSVKKSSPLAKSLASKQSNYIQLYGSTGQNPIL